RDELRFDRVERRRQHVRHDVFHHDHIAVIRSFESLRRRAMNHGGVDAEAHYEHQHDRQNLDLDTRVAHTDLTLALHSATPCRAVQHQRKMPKSSAVSRSMSSKVTSASPSRTKPETKEMSMWFASCGLGCIMPSRIDST